MRILNVMFLLVMSMTMSMSVSAGVVKADCDPAKAAKSAVAKSTVGVGGRCHPVETAKDTAKDTVDNAVDKVVPDKLQKDKNDKNLVKRSAKKVIE